MSWRPLLTGSLADEARAALDDIADALEANPPTTPDLGNGLGGLALFFAYRGLAFADDHADDVADVLAQRMLESLEQAAVPTLYGGFPGCGWVIEHLFGDQDESDVVAAFDSTLSPILALEPWTMDTDLITGLTGLGVYALERGSRPEPRRLLERVVEHLTAAAIEDKRGVHWQTPPSLLPEHQRRVYPNGYVNLGVAHGLPGTLRLLCAAARVDVPGALELADGAARWLLSTRLPSSSASAFPTIAGSSSPSRLAWCYGDPGVAAALIAGGRDADRQTWVDAGVEIARAAGARDLVDGDVLDAGLCHGAIGLAHLYNRMHQATGDSALAESALAYYRTGLKMRATGAVDNVGIAGFTEFHIEPGTPGIHRGNRGFITGVAGIGLGLLAALSDVEPSWDRLLAVDASPLALE